ncbi:hypothetical protein acsn021_09800 [Anaerocolumna cellulosilytica]|uniref:Uncharacterized protein n=1 Tax=Anaerocolumna cellulosilytica TaxID=433286 RepID=A0A6S6R2K9_9FIRM|nr:hypothetical protein [Anaerocolumna cellulosilytica]MBB5194466.1 hypothetical protein [Anaerocolumna cellulosilytica]BCJ93411.1 hypothetical protein acsn021_09800 [Anaerocolumna cellulosilytica]
MSAGKSSQKAFKHKGYKTSTKKGMKSCVTGECKHKDQTIPARIVNENSLLQYNDQSKVQLPVYIKEMAQNIDVIKEKRFIQNEKQNNNPLLKAIPVDEGKVIEILGYAVLEKN